MPALVHVPVSVVAPVPEGFRDPAYPSDPRSCYSNGAFPASSRRGSTQHVAAACMELNGKQWQVPQQYRPQPASQAAAVPAGLSTPPVPGALASTAANCQQQPPQFTGIGEPNPHKQPNSIRPRPPPIAFTGRHTKGPRSPARCVGSEGGVIRLDGASQGESDQPRRRSLIPVPISPVSKPLAPAQLQQQKTPLEQLSFLLEEPHRDRLKEIVLDVFQLVAPADGALDIEGLAKFRSVLLERLEIPEEAFGDLATDHARFDFGGDGRLDVNEAYKLVKFNLWEYLQEVQGDKGTADVPMKSLEEAGFTIIERLGQGNQAEVWLCIDADGVERCIKCYSKDKLTAGAITTMMAEFRAMQLLGCKRIAQAYEIFQDLSSYYMVNEVYHGGDFQMLRQRVEAAGVQIDEDWWKKVFKQCFRALEFMHQQAMMHCDIKEANLMLKTVDFAHPEVVVVDFGVTKAMGATEKFKLCGTPGYIPPETFRERKWFPGGDVFSLGVVMFQMLSDTTPPPNAKYAHETKGLFLEGCMTMEHVMEATLTRQPAFELLPAEYPGLTALTQRVLEKDHQTRPRAPMVLSDPWFTRPPRPSTGYVGGNEFATMLGGTHRDSGPLTGRHRMATEGMLPDYVMKIREELEQSKKRKQQVQNTWNTILESVQEGSPPSTIAAEQSCITEEAAPPERPPDVICKTVIEETRVEQVQQPGATGQRTMIRHRFNSQSQPALPQHQVEVQQEQAQATLLSSSWTAAQGAMDAPRVDLPRQRSQSSVSQREQATMMRQRSQPQLLGATAGAPCKAPLPAQGMSAAQAAWNFTFGMTNGITPRRGAGGFDGQNSFAPPVNRSPVLVNRAPRRGGPLPPSACVGGMAGYPQQMPPASRSLAMPPAQAVLQNFAGQPRMGGPMLAGAVMRR